MDLEANAVPEPAELLAAALGLLSDDYDPFFSPVSYFSIL